jgi:glycosyltransferase involved in cell wall biosynthesis
MNLLILYSEAMPYTISMINNYLETPNNQVCLVSWDSNLLTKFNFKPNRFLYYKRSEVNAKYFDEIIINFNPSIILVSGRMDKGYLNYIKKYKNKIPLITLSDNQWEASFKQIVIKRLAFLFYRKYFDYFLVPGYNQFCFARNIGYPTSKILVGGFSIDVKKFTDFNRERLKINTNFKQKIILFIGRLCYDKGIDLLLNAYLELENSILQNWKLYVFGGIEAADKSIKNFIKQNTNSNIIFYDFQTQDRILNEIVDKDIIFILPSRKEPYGVVVQEMVSAGLPIITSDICGSNQDFLINGFNGYSFKSNNIESLKNAIHELAIKNLNERLKFGSNSLKLSNRHNPDFLTSVINSVLVKW